MMAIAPALPTRNVKLLALVIAGASSTVSVKFCLASGAMPLLALIVSGHTLPVPAAGVPLSMPAALKVTPVGSCPVSEKDGVGVPMAVTVNASADPTLKVVLLPLVIAGGSAAAADHMSMYAWAELNSGTN